MLVCKLEDLNVFCNKRNKTRLGNNFLIAKAKLQDLKTKRWKGALKNFVWLVLSGCI